jgi:ketosteroid isomerase-like protein
MVAQTETGSTMSENEATINRLYEAFARRDHAAMASCYSTDATFSDPVFGTLTGGHIAAMWHLLCEQGTDLKLTHSKVQADESTGSAHWEPVYTFGPSGRLVHNVIDAEFVFADGEIINHSDHFDLWRWMRMALGLPGTLIGWTPSAKRKVRATAARGLQRFLTDHPEYHTE